MSTADNEKNTENEIITLLANKELEWVELADGLKMFHETSTDNNKPKLGDKIEVHYTGWLTDGAKFDSSVDRGETITFPLVKGGLIEGWVRGIPEMGEGGTAYLFIPSALAYGEQGAGGTIGPGADLVFKVELIKINP
jgi:FKBP-type peptidyl-prolyl cis-trans isomerase